MKRKKRVKICIALFLCIICLTSCGWAEISDQNNIRETMVAIETSINSKNKDMFKDVFSSSVAPNVSESDIEKIFSLFPSGITYQNTDSENYPMTVERAEGDDYVRALEWKKEFIDQSTGKTFVMTVFLCTENWNDESAIGVKYIIFYDVEQEESALDWLHSVDEEVRFEGIYIYGE